MKEGLDPNHPLWRTPKVACQIHVQTLEDGIPCPYCSLGEPAHNPECVKNGHVPKEPGRISDCVRCGGPMAFRAVYQEAYNHFPQSTVDAILSGRSAVEPEEE